MEQAIGKVVHYYDKIGVAVVKLSGPLAEGEKIKIRQGEHEFEDTVSSMQLEHQPVSSASSGQEVAIKVSQPTKAGAEVLKLS